MSPDPKSPRRTTAHPIPLDDATRELVRGKARQIAHRIGLPRTDLSDLQQDLEVHVWTRLDGYDPERNPDRTAFARMLVGHAAATVFRDQLRRLRRSPVSLDALLRSGMPEPTDPHPGPGEVGGAALDVPAVLAALPPELRRVAVALKGGSGSVTAAARRLGVSRQAVYRQLEQIRAALTAAGLEDFFSAGARTPGARAG